MMQHDELESLSIAHIDCDAFFAAVEKRDDPSGEILVVEKVLAETPGGCGLQLR
jgi:hypothetical protein